MLKIAAVLITVFYVGLLNVKTTKTDCQKWAGIYSRSDDFTINHFSDSICLDDKDNKLKIGSLNKLIFQAGNKKLIFKPGEIYGFFDGDSHYRFFETNGPMYPYGYFKIRDTSGLIFYSQRHASRYGSSTSYFYSKSVTDTIKDLKMKNLKADFYNAEFLNKIEPKVEKIINMNPEKATLTIQEINAIYREHFRQ